MTPHTAANVPHGFFGLLLSVGEEWPELGSMDADLDTVLVHTLELILAGMTFVLVPSVVRVLLVKGHHNLIAVDLGDDTC